ncbi:glycerophosphodiester phosphodiesterase family protein [Aureimonas sp. AU12]|uniref:glycerophosphodiester phosphodiesterase family protein n=1 Tax=Aureimonas sp. AU12 TaxID=1638161 RepID=UPI000782891F|nr:glycerophosphodiester phosphodiesterase family protein [Aureimonas sp. AU12]
MPPTSAIQRSFSEAPRTVSAVLSLANPDVLVIAHRGVWDMAPENSLAAIRAAIALGLDMVEIDARLSRDGTPVVIHDATLDRTTDRTGAVEAFDLASLKEARLRQAEGGADAALTAECIPTLAEALEEARGRILVNIDTKRDEDLAAISAVALDLGLGEGVLIKAAVDPASAAALDRDHLAFGPLPFMPLLTAREGRFADDIARLAPLRPMMVECNAEGIAALAEGREALKAGGIRLWVNSLDCSHIAGFSDTKALPDPQAVWGALLEAGVTAIQTDRANELVAFLVAVGRRQA